MRHPFAWLRPGIAAVGLGAALLAGCGGGGDSDSTHTVSVRIDTPVAAGESFQFSLGSQSLTITQSGVAGAFPTALAEGAAYTVNQAAGPRTCTFSANRTGTIPAADVLVTANCGSPAGTSSLIGELRAPVGTAVTLRNNGGDDLGVTVPAPVPPADPDQYNVRPFTFATPLVDGTAYAVSIAATSANQTCSVYKGGNGTMPVGTGVLKVGCEWTYDHVSRNSDSSVRATYFNSEDPVSGGAAAAVGTTVDAYGEGRFVAFVSNATGLSPNGPRQIFWRDRLTGETRLISANAAGDPGNDGSFAPAISADGLTVVFESYATNLVSGDTNGVRDLFVWSRNGSTPGVQRISVDAGGAQANGESFQPTISGDGRIVAFISYATNLTADVTSSAVAKAYRRDLGAGANVLVSKNMAGNGVGGNGPAVSEDGNRIAYWSFAADIVAGDTNGIGDIFVYQHSDGSQRRVSLTATGGQRTLPTLPGCSNESSSRAIWPAISGNGRFVAYATTSDNLVTGDTNCKQDVFIVDLDGALGVRRASLGTAGAQGTGDTPVGQGERVALSFDGTWMAFTSNSTNFGATNPGTNVFLRNLTTGDIRALTDATFGAGPPAMSREGAYVVFGAASRLDSRFTDTGLFAYFTGAQRAWWWID